MAESDLEKNAEFSQAYGHNHDGEDPRVAAQRLLNIFRQLHIFSAHKRQEFNDNLLNQPMAVKRALALLPGGSLVLEYLNDLQEKAGMQSDSSLVKSSKENIKKEILSEENHDEIAQVKILAKALSEAQFQPSALSNDDVKKISKDLYDKFDTLKKDLENRIASFDGKSPLISHTDESLAKTISDAAQNIALQQEQISKLKQDFLLKFSGWADSNQELIQSIAARTDFHNASNQDNPASALAQNFAPFDFEAIISQITEKQAEMFKEFSKQQADNLANILSDVLKENNSASLKIIEQALHTFQSENARFLEIQTNLKNSMPASSHDLETSENAFYSVPDKNKNKSKKRKKEIFSDNVSHEGILASSDNISEYTDKDEKEENQNIDNESLSAEDGDYVWEYVEDGENALLSSEDGDYVWEYVEDDSAEDYSAEDYSSEEEGAVEAKNPVEDDSVLPVSIDDTEKDEKNFYSNPSQKKIYDDAESTPSVLKNMVNQNIFSPVQLSGIADIKDSPSSPYPKPAL